MNAVLSDVRDYRLSLRLTRRSTLTRLRASELSVKCHRTERDLKIYGYKDEGLEPQDVRPGELAEITLVATPDELRRIAKFMNQAAEGMEARGRNWEHEHLSDKDKSFRDSPQFVIYNPEAAK